MLPQKRDSYMTLPQKKIGLIIGSGDLAVYCIEKLAFLGHEIIILRLPCSPIKIARDIKYIDIQYERISEALSFLKQHSVSDIAFIGYLERPEIDVSKASADAKNFIQSCLDT